MVRGKRGGVPAAGARGRVATSEPGEARARGVKISGEVCPHHIALTDDAIKGFDTNYKVNPPLRSQKDVDALLDGVADGTLSILCSDHAPHALFEKEVEFDVAPFGIIGLETELGLFINLLVHKHRKIDIARLIAMYTVEPARLLGIDAGALSVGAGSVALSARPILPNTVATSGKVRSIRSWYWSCRLASSIEMFGKVIGM